MGVFGLNLLLLKTENWKHCSKIIFKCVIVSWDLFLIFFNMWTVYAQCVNNVYTVHNSKNCFPTSTNTRKKKKKCELINVDAEPKRHLYCWIFLPQYEQDQKKKKWRTDIFFLFCSFFFFFFCWIRQFFCSILIRNCRCFHILAEREW